MMTQKDISMKAIKKDIKKYMQFLIQVYLFLYISFLYLQDSFLHFLSIYDVIIG